MGTRCEAFGSDTAAPHVPVSQFHLFMPDLTLSCNRDRPTINSSHLVWPRCNAIGGHEGLVADQGGGGGSLEQLLSNA